MFLFILAITLYVKCNSAPLSTQDAHLVPFELKLSILDNKRLALTVINRGSEPIVWDAYFTAFISIDLSVNGEIINTNKSNAKDIAEINRFFLIPQNSSYTKEIDLIKDSLTFGGTSTIYDRVNPRVYTVEYADKSLATVLKKGDHIRLQYAYRVNDAMKEKVMIKYDSCKILNKILVGTVPSNTVETTIGK